MADVIPVASPRKSIKKVNKSEVFVPETMEVKSDTKKCTYLYFWCNATQNLPKNYFSNIKKGFNHLLY